MANEQQRDIGLRLNLIPEEEARRRRLETLREKGINPYPSRVMRTHTISEILQHFDEWQSPEGSFTITGRIRLMREMGKVAFLKIEDGTGSMQAYFRINDIGEDAYRLLKLLDVGDFVQVSGFLFLTRTGEPTVHVREYCLLSKGLRPL
ncbi:MAG TPA: OB-fold nucleic acid binding domain-containing protein, partial [Ktedonobacteraceae bacterium]|nr:OB-fold nucleic acid binding domain-containing protein [Ktedonobacteraceae bacterium]